MLNKRILSIVIIFVMVFALTGCLGTKEDDGQSETAAESVTGADDQTEPVTEDKETSSEPAETEDATGNGEDDVYEGFLDNNTEAEEVYHLVYGRDFSGNIAGSCSVDDFSPDIVFYADWDVTDLKVITLEFNGEQLLEKTVVGEIQSLTAGDGFSINTYLPETIPDLMISFTDKNGVNQNLLISENRKDGIPALYEKWQ